MEILYDDNYITVCVKEPMTLSEKSDSGDDILSKLDAYYKENEQAASAYPLHRLDFGVGGVMVFAKNREAAAKMSALIQEGKLDKQYYAVISGKPSEEKGTYRDLLFKDSKKNKSFVVDRKRAGVREAVLDYELVNTKVISGEELSLVRIKLHTGRSHQIRVQFSSRKTPLYGDRKYGAKLGDAIALWSCSLSFPHPKTKIITKIEKEPQGGVWDNFFIM